MCTGVIESRDYTGGVNHCLRFDLDEDALRVRSECVPPTDMHVTSKAKSDYRGLRNSLEMYVSTPTPITMCAFFGIDIEIFLHLLPSPFRNPLRDGLFLVWCYITVLLSYLSCYERKLGRAAERRHPVSVGLGDRRRSCGGRRGTGDGAGTTRSSARE